LNPCLSIGPRLRHLFIGDLDDPFEGTSAVRPQLRVCPEIGRDPGKGLRLNALSLLANEILGGKT
jgi:hypothetical protein